MENKTPKPIEKCQEAPIEKWVDIPNYEGLYQAGSFGNIKSLYFGKEKLLIPSFHSSGYLVVTLCKNEVQTNRLIHQLIAEAFLGYNPDGTLKIVVDHIDNDPFNNRLDNLQLTTHRHNCSKDKKGSSKYIGVCWDKRQSMWIARIRFGKRRIHLGYFDLELDAAFAYQKALAEWSQGLDLNEIYNKRRTTN